MKKQFHEAPEGLFSFTRWQQHLLTYAVPATELFWLGGRVIKSEEAVFLVSQGALLRLSDSPAEWQPGDLVCVQFCYSDYSASAQLIEKIKQYRILWRPRKSQTEVKTEFDFIRAQKWAQFLARIRAVFAVRGLMEVTTPTLVRNPGMEPELEPFSVQWRTLQNSNSKRLYLSTSPELHMKQMLAQGFTDIYEIKTVFRNEEYTAFHEPEFQMLEWYRAYADAAVLVNDLQAILNSCDFAGEIQKTNVAELFKRSTGTVLRPDTRADELKTILSDIGEIPAPDSTWADLFHHIWAAKVEPTLPKEPLLVFDYPPQLAALARLHTNGWAQRFELYWGGVEIANAFVELTDPAEQRQRFLSDKEKRKHYGRTELEIDENFMAALDWGLPPSTGMALGLDRLFQVSANIHKIQDARAFPVAHQIRD